MSPTRAAALEGMLLSLWLGASALFTLVVARAAFAVLPSRTLAGALVGRVLPVLYLTGIGVGVALVAIEWPSMRERWGRLAAGATIAVACAIAQFYVAPRIEQLRRAIGGPLEALAAGDPHRAAFGRLHGISVAWLGIAVVAALVALFLTWRALDVRPASGSPTPTIQTNG
ncbi:MAG: DUF4149 domain-containing protein [Gemmatimonadaceae bacterium]|nr:DUF4149 domain-containing protein [Gemmatimonadaceae bacterium]